MNIGLLTGEFPPQHGGIADFTRILATALADRGHAVRVITTLSAQTTQHFSAPYTVHPVARHWGWLDLWRVRQCTADLDICIITLFFGIHYHNWHGDSCFA